MTPPPKYEYCDFTGRFIFFLIVHPAYAAVCTNILACQFNFYTMLVLHKLLMRWGCEWTFFPINAHLTWQNSIIFLLMEMINMRTKICENFHGKSGKNLSKNMRHQCTVCVYGCEGEIYRRFLITYPRRSQIAINNNLWSYLWTPHGQKEPGLPPTRHTGCPHIMF